MESGTASIRDGDFLLRASFLSELQVGSHRKVPGRQGMTYEEQDGVDQDATRHRRPDE
jgi:hypothetical protein